MSVDHSRLTLFLSNAQILNPYVRITEHFMSVINISRLMIFKERIDNKCGKIQSF